MARTVPIPPKLFVGHFGKTIHLGITGGIKTRLQPRKIKDPITLWDLVDHHCKET